MVQRDSCEYCQKDDVLITSTPELGSYCKECLELASWNCKEAIKEINEYEKANKTPRKKKEQMTETRLQELEKKKDEALAKLMQGF
jgi:inactivated superfamily I helicase